MKKYTLFHIPPLSFFSTELYLDVADNWKGIGFGYLFLLLALCWLVLVISIDQSIDSYLDEYAPDLISQFPTITIIDGQASIEETQPYYINDPETGQIIGVIDTTGSITSLDRTEAVVLLTRTNVMFEKSKVETRTFNLSDVGDFVLDQEMLSGLVNITKSYLSVVIYPFALMGSYLYRIIQMLIYAAIGLLFASICKTKLEYDQLLRLSVVAVTPCIIISTLLWSISIDLPMEGLMYFLLTMVYLFLGIKTTAETQEEA